MVFRLLASRWVQDAARRAVTEAMSQVAEGVEAKPDQSDEPVGPPQQCDVAIVFALSIEAGGLVDLLEGATKQRGPEMVEHIGMLDGRAVAVVESGVGNDRAAKATADVIRVRSPKLVISAGLAGGLKENVRTGDIVLGRSVTDTHGQAFPIAVPADEVIAAIGDPHIGQVLTVDQLVRDPATKQRYGEQYEAICCDMETLAVAKQCQLAKISFLSVRIISDGVDDQLPDYLQTLLDQKTTSSQIGAAAGALFRQPSRIKQMWQLKEDALIASDKLAQFLRRLCDQIPSDQIDLPNNDP